MEIDKQFLEDFQTGVLPFEQWTHAAHIRMAYLVCRSSTNFQEALERIRQGIQHFNGLHASKLKIGFHESMTRLWAILVWNATQKCNRTSIDDSKKFIEQNSHLMDSSLWKQYYSPTLMFSSEAKSQFIEPDLQAISIDEDN